MTDETLLTEVGRLNKAIQRLGDKLKEFIPHEEIVDLVANRMPRKAT